MDVSSTTMKQVLFLCTGNYYRSRFAEELFNHCASKQALGWIADSKGMARRLPNPRNAGPMATWALERLAELNVHPRRHHEHAQSVEASHLERADLIIALSENEHKPMMEKHFPQWTSTTFFWDVEDYPLWTSQQTFERIEDTMENLLQQL